MQKTKIEWCVSPDGSPGYTWNPASGCLGPGGTLEDPRRCFGCYAAKIAARFGKTDVARAFLPEFHPERIEQPFKRKTPTTIFVCSMADLWGDWVPDSWIRQVLDQVIRCPWHRFIFLTKNPKRYSQFSPYSFNAWLGVTTRNQWEYDQAAELMPAVEAGLKLISVEPMLGPIDLRPDDAWKPDWILIGDLTKNGRPMGKTKDEWATELTAQAGHNRIPVFHKDSLLERGYKSRELPGGQNAGQQTIF